jgi:hypothetical protein
MSGRGANVDWVPVSASALIAGVTTLSLGALLLPSGDGDSAQTLMLASQQDDRWLAVSALFFLASVAMTLGLPSILVLFRGRGNRLGMTALVVFAVGCIGTAGYAMLLAFFRALAIAHAITDDALAEVSRDNGLNAFLYGWVAAFYLGELLLAVALLRARATPRWVSFLLIGHVAMAPLSPVLPHSVESGSVLLMAVGFAGVAISANNAELATTRFST